MEKNKHFLSKERALMGNKIYRGTSKVSSSSTPHRNMYKCLLQEKRENDLSIEKTWLLLQRQESHEEVWPMKLYTIAMSLSGQVICTFNIPSKTENLLCIQRHTSALAINSLMYRAIYGVGIPSVTLITHTKKHKRLWWSGCLVQRGVQW